jgi:hypothetical protein
MQASFHSLPDLRIIKSTAGSAIGSNVSPGSPEVFRRSAIDVARAPSRAQN